MVGKLLLRGLLAGVIAGLLVFAIGRFVGEPPLDWAIGYEERQSAQPAAAPAASHEHAQGIDAAAAHSHGGDEEELVSRTTQAGLGLFTGTVVFSVAVGGLFALIFAFVYGRFSAFGARATSAIIAFTGFVSVALVPGLKYPATPPAVGNPDTIGLRTAVFFGMIVVSVSALVVAIGFARGLVARHGSWNAAVAGALAYVAMMAVAGYVLPMVNDVPETFSPTILWQFRLASFAMQATLWAVLGIVFGFMAERVLGTGGAAASVRLAGAGRA